MIVRSPSCVCRHPAVPVYPAAGAGFVLVSVLLIIALATILVVVASMMAQIERTAASNSARVEMARMNALFALEVALNQLQAAAGPDQRITARAEILDSTPDTRAITGVNQPYWTGVWRTGPNPLDVGSNPQRQRSLGASAPGAAEKAARAVWLVSGATNGSPLDFVGLTNGTGRNAVTVATRYGPSAPHANVVVPLVDVTAGGTTNGAYGYWISDEGLKAKVNSTAATLGAAGRTERQIHHLASHAAAPHKGILGAGNATDLRISAAADLAKVSTLASLQNVSGVAAGTLVAPQASALAADATTHGAGVLSDVRRGGLRKDLTAAFENGAAYGLLTNTFGHGAGMVYRSASGANLTTPAIDTGVTPPTDGLPWFSLYAFYNAYKGQTPVPVPGLGNPNPTRASATPAADGNPNALPGVLSPRVLCLNLPGSGTTAAKLGALMPVPIAYRLDIALSSYQQGGLWRLRLHYFPQLVLWNPYSVRLEFPGYQFQRSVGAFATRGTRTFIGVTVGGTPVAVPTAFDDPHDSLPAYPASAIVLNQETDYRGRLQLRTASGDCNVLEPGETRVFALAGDLSRNNILAAHTFSDLVSNPGVSADFSQFTDLPGFAGTPDGTSPVNVTLNERRLRCAFIDTFAIPDRLKWPWNDGALTSIATRYAASGGWETAAANTPWDSALQIQQLNAAPRRIIGFYVRAKGLNPSSGSRAYSNAATHVPIFSGNAAPASLVDDNFSFTWQEVYLSPLGTLYQNNETDVQMMLSGSTWETSFGMQSAGSAPGSTRVVLRDVPRTPMISLGQFMHMPAANFRSIGVYEQLTFGSMFVGGSYASPVIATDRNALSLAIGTASNNVPNDKLFLDDSFLANEALFDRFYFSTVPPAALNAPGTTYPLFWTAFQAANPGAVLTDHATPLLNGRMRPIFRNGSGPALADLRDVNRAAAHLLVDGAFNINSTSVEAWKAVLAGVSGNPLELFDAGAREIRMVSTAAGTPFARFWSASGRTAANEPWSGLRLLSDAELDDLATRIVEQVKSRGPFLSLADFLNRRLGEAGPLTRSGALQAAIDLTEINSSIKTAGREVNAATPIEATAPPFLPINMVDAAGRTWNTALGMPGYLMQQDLVQVLAPAISARSDTFLVRAYGETRNPSNGGITGRAWCEAVVQRTPEFADASQVPESDQAAVDANPINGALGRRFQILSFRWLADEEV